MSGHDHGDGAGLNLTLQVWRQNGPHDEGHFETFHLDGSSNHCSFLEMLDQLNERLVAQGREVDFFPGVESWFDEITAYVSSESDDERRARRRRRPAGRDARTVLHLQILLPSWSRR